MLTDAAVLTLLGSLLSPGEVPDILRRLLRVPEVWAAVHRPGFVSSGMSATDLTPAALARHALGLPANPSEAEPLPATLESRLETLWQSPAGTPPFKDQPLEDVALLAIGLVREAAQRDGGTKVVARMLPNVASWRSALACAWPELASRQQIFSQLAGQSGDEGPLLAINAVLANASLADAAQEVDHALSGSIESLIPVLLRQGETAFAQALGGQPGSTAKVAEGSTSVGGLRRVAARRMAQGAYADAREVLTRAWEIAADDAAQVADDLAATAHLENERFFEVEALQQAVKSHPTPERRARLAAALAAQHQPQEALAALPAESQSVAEKIAAGVAFTELGEADHASMILADAAESALGATSIQPGWLSRLAQALVENGKSRAAIQIADAHAKALPSDPSPRRQLAAMLEAAGSYEAAASHASVALALEPGSDETRRVLAKALQASGEPGAALPHWHVLAANSDGDRAALAECALQAGLIELARDTSASLLETSPDSVPALVTLGRAHIACGDHTSAREYLDKAVALAPQHAEAWIAMADCQMAEGEVAAAGTTLASAVQATPGNGCLLHAYSRWLKDRGRLSEALQAAEKSIRVTSTDPGWLANYGDLLRRLGHLDRALPVLQDVLAQRPASWEAAMPLALTWEECGEVSKAAGILATMDAPIPDAAVALVGRILISDPRPAGPEVIARGMAALAQALDRGDTDPQVGYWYGIALERTERHAEAMERFRPYLDISSAVEPGLRLKAVHGFARCAMESGQTALALSTLEQACGQYPASSELLVALSGAYLASDLPREALQNAQKAVDLAPKNLAALGRLSEAALLAGEPDRALTALERQAGLNPQAAEPQLAIARLAMQAGKTLETRRAIAHAARLGRRQATSLQSAAELLVSMGELDSAHRFLRRAASLEPSDKSLLRRSAEVSDEVRDHQGAQVAWSRLAELEPDDPDVLKHAARSQWDVGRHSAAIGFWQRASARDPEDPGLDRALGAAYLAEGDTSRGLQAYADALAKAPADPVLALEVGQAAIRHGAYHQAKSALETAARLAPDPAEPMTRLGECWMMMGNTVEAQSALGAACAAAPMRAEPHALLASALWIQGDLPAAMAALGKARQLPPESPAAAVAVARSAMHLARWADARATLDAAMKSWADDAAVKLEAVRARVRMAEAAWIFAEVADARAHAPSADCSTDTAYAEIQTLLDGVNSVSPDGIETRPLRLRSELAFGHADAATFAEAEANVNLDETGELRETLVIAQLRAHRAQDAARALAGWSDKRSASEWSALLFGLAGLESAQAEPARQALLAAGQNPVLRPLTEFLIGRSWMAAGRTEGFTEHASQALVAWPDEPVWHYQLANAYLEQGQADAALPHLHQAVELAPQEGDYRLALARTLRDTGQTREAQATFSELLGSMPPIGTVWKEAGLCAVSNADYPRALPWLDRASVLLPSDAECLVGLARAAMHLGRNKDAHDHIESALRIAPEDPQVLLAFGEIMSGQGKFEKAIQAYDRALRRSSDPLPVKMARSRLLINVGRATQAAAEMAEIVAANPTVDEAWAALAAAQDASGEREAAMASATKAAELAPSRTANRVALGRLCRKAGQLDRALNELAQAQAASPADPLVWMELGQVYEDRREYKRSLDAYQRAIELDTDNPTAHFHAGLVLKNIKAYPQAGHMFQRAVELNPKDPDALHQLAAVRALELVHGGIAQQAVTQ